MRTFRDFMEWALYDPEQGFYSRRLPTSDFYTAPELSPAFAGVLAREIIARAPEGPFAIVEMGAGEGRLAGQILDALRGAAPELYARARYAVVERCGELLERAVGALRERHPRVDGFTRLEDLPPCAGVFLSNELVDAFPVHLVEKRGGKVYELWVDENGRSVLAEPSRPELAPGAAALEDGARHAVNLEAARWLRLVSEKLLSGALITVDYGGRLAGAANPPRAFFRHSVTDGVAERPGLQDITASVDFDQLIAEGERVGLRLHSYQTLSRFLIERGIGDWLDAGDDAASFRRRSQVKTLLHPDGMGEVFKVLIQTKGGAAS